MQRAIQFPGSTSIIVPILLPPNIEIGDPGIIKSSDDSGEIRAGIGANLFLENTLYDQPLDKLIEMAWRPTLPQTLDLIALYSGEGR